MQDDIRRLNGTTAPFRYWFTYISEENGGEFVQPLKKTYHFRYNLAPILSSAPSFKEKARAFKQATRFVIHRIRTDRAVVKDPIALYSADWLSRTFNMKPVVLLRHPAAFAASLKIRNWTHPFQDFLDQPLLMRDSLAPFKEKIEEFSRVEMPLVDQAGLLWNMSTWRINQFREAFPDWIYLRHEDISSNPVRGFQELYTKLGLDFTNKARTYVIAHSIPEQSSREARFRHLSRNSVENMSTWRYRLTPAEIDLLYGAVRDLSANYYSDDEW